MAAFHSNTVDYSAFVLRFFVFNVFSVNYLRFRFMLILFLFTKVSLNFLFLFIFNEYCKIKEKSSERSAVHCSCKVLTIFVFYIFFKLSELYHSAINLFPIRSTFEYSRHLKVMHKLDDGNHSNNYYNFSWCIKSMITDISSNLGVSRKVIEFCHPHYPKIAEK